MFSNHASARPQRGAGRRRPDDRRAARQPVDADVQEAADDRAEEAGERRASAAGRVTAAAPCAAALGSGCNGDDGDRRRSRPSGIESRTARRSDRPGCRADRRRGRASASRAAARRPRACSASTIALQRVDLVERVELQQAPLARRCAATRSRRTARIACHIWRDDCAVAALGQRRRGQRPQPPRRARHVGWPASNHVGRCLVVVVATSSARTRCPACTPTYRARSRKPFSSRAMARSGRPAPPGYGSARKIDAEPIGDVEVRIERRREVEQRIQERRSSSRLRPRRASAAAPARAVSAQRSLVPP